MKRSDTTPDSEVPAGATRRRCSQQYKRRLLERLGETGGA